MGKDEEPLHVVAWSQSAWGEELRRREWAKLRHDTVRDTGAIIGGTMVGTAALSVGMVRSRRFRYITQAVLHFPFACTIVFAAVFAALVQSAGPVNDNQAGGVVVKALGLGFLAALVGGSLWTFAYVKLRTQRKLRRLERMSQPAAMPGYAPQGYYQPPTYQQQY